VTLEQLPNARIKTEKLLYEQYKSVVENLKINESDYQDYQTRNRLKQEGKYVDLSMLQYQPDMQYRALDYWKNQVVDQQDGKFYQLADLVARKVGIHE
jgi:hypothetical protein